MTAEPKAALMPLVCPSSPSVSWPGVPSRTQGSTEYPPSSSGSAAPRRRGGRQRFQPYPSSAPTMRQLTPEPHSRFLPPEPGSSYTVNESGPDLAPDPTLLSNAKQEQTGRYWKLKSKRRCDECIRHDRPCMVDSKTRGTKKACVSCGESKRSCSLAKYGLDLDWLTPESRRHAEGCYWVIPGL
ncbi:hypothetical protein BCR39DRAFT_518169 [Naematelia encephala]|uniref:Uncharacterized protein n=1 Tax=Naematelia encephala TaxID=71784 RepID=A0A1Y2BH03_9TREE|nr:hypothetical protein BCR39DRAFT_518169 [Naematelia encephala]